MARGVCVQKEELSLRNYSHSRPSPDSETQVARKESRSTTVNHHDWTQTLPRQTSSMSGRVCAFPCKKRLVPKSVNEPKHPCDKEDEHQHQGARLGGLVGECQVKEYGGLPVVGLVPTSSWVGRRPVLGKVPQVYGLGHPACGARSSLLGSWHIAMPRGPSHSGVCRDSNTLE